MNLIQALGQVGSIADPKLVDAFSVKINGIGYLVLTSKNLIPKSLIGIKLGTNHKEEPIYLGQVGAHTSMLGWRLHFQTSIPIYEGSPASNVCVEGHTKEDTYTQRFIKTQAGGLVEPLEEGFNIEDGVPIICFDLQGAKKPVAAKTTYEIKVGSGKPFTDQWIKLAGAAEDANKKATPPPPPAPPSKVGVESANWPSGQKAEWFGIPVVCTGREQLVGSLTFVRVTLNGSEHGLLVTDLVKS